MTRRDRSLRLILRVTGVWTFVAIGAVFMPTSWMAAIHERLGLGEFPATPLVLNLARCVSYFYAFYGAVLVYIAGDIQRYRPLIRFVGVLTLIFGIVLLGVDYIAGMPHWWTFSEGLATFGIGVLILMFSREED